MSKQQQAITYKNVDFSDPASLEAYAKQLEGMTFQDVLDLGITPENISRDYGRRQYKGGVGTLIEERYFGYKANSDAHADFAEAGVELKTTCYDMKKNNDPSAGERLVLTMIPFDRQIDDDFYSSHLWDKARSILLIYYARDKGVSTYDQRIQYVTLFTPPETDLKIIRDDYAKIVGLIENGRADELSESQTTYLGACTKGATEATMWVDQYYAPGRKAKKRAFCFKRQYMDYVLHHYIMGQADKADSIVRNSSILGNRTFEDYVTQTIGAHAGKTDRELCKELSLEYTGGKAQWSSITYAMLGIHGDKAEEFEKANISARSVRVETNNKITESISLNTFRFLDLVKEEWDTSTLHNYFDETRFLFVVFRRENDSLVLKGASFWAMPQKDLEGPVHTCWQRTVDTLEDGVTFTSSTNRSGKTSYGNNLPNKTDKLVCHVRPHTGHAAYRFNDGTVVGNVDRDAYELPDGQWMTRQSFWLNNDYVYGVIEDAGL